MNISTSLKTLALTASMLFATGHAFGAGPDKAENGNIVISKVFYAGSTRLNGATPKNYLLNLYIELYNNSANEVDITGMYIALPNSDNGDAAWTATAMATEHKDSIVVKQIFQIPDDKTYLVQPGQSIVIANCAIDHSQIAEGNVDLSDADFEVKSQNAAYADYHNDNVPELKLVSSFGTADFINLLNPGPSGVVLLKADTNISACPKTYGRGKSTGNEYTIVPGFKTIDCVDIVRQKEPSADDKRIVENYDAGFTCTESSETFNAQAVVRRTAFVTGDGRTVLFDTNNSSTDFESTDDLALRTYATQPSGLTDSTIVIPATGFLPINTSRPFCGPKEVKFVYVNASNNDATTDLKYQEYPGDSLLLIAGPWVAVAQPGTYTLQLSASQGVMRSRTSIMVWADEDTKTLSGTQATRRIYKFKADENRVGFERVPATADGQYNYADFTDGNRLYITLTDKVGERIFEANGASSWDDLDFITWHGSQPQAAPIDDMPVANSIAEFLSIEDGKTVKLMLNNARVNAYNDLFWLYYIEDATGVAELCVKRYDAPFKAGDVLDGYLVGQKETKQLDFMDVYPDMMEHILNFTDDTQTSTVSITEGTLEPTPATIAEATTEGNHGKLMVISDAVISLEGRFYYAYQNDDRIQVKDELGVLPDNYEWPAKAKSITGIVTYNGVRWQIAPIAADSIVPDTETGIATVTTTATAPAYNLQGQRVRTTRPGLYIIGGKKVVIR